MSVRQYTYYDAKIEPVDGGGVEITFHNYTGHRVTFFVDGGDTPVYVELDGNTSHTMPSLINEFLAVHVDNKEGELLATTKVDLASYRTLPLQIQE